MIYFLLIIISFFISLIAIFFLKKLAFRYHLYDEPSVGDLKIHQKPIPHLGGIGIFLGLIASLIFSQLFHQISKLQSLGIIIGSIIIIFLGFWDDLKWKKVGRPMIKFLCQFIAGFLIVFILIKIGVNLHFSINSIIASLIAGIYIVGAMNAINMEDGLNGLAGSITIISLMGFIYLAVKENNLFTLIISLGTLSGILGFLIYNWHPASIFMGDNGSHFLGFILAILAIMFTGHNLKQFIGPILIIGLPIIDTTLVIIRRLIKRKPLFLGDRSHLYDLIHQKGISIPKTVFIYSIIQFIIVSIGILIYNL
ncbi:MAG: MraY family glycosyltransferase [Patescibacteria group bacterium]|nr:MraY family glycosyltransferase [Patescibacteria group bacterium]MDD5164186.1 MraY family glycosyltransferase [Patescibacteria group bacterium]MDD5534480.1 MraY family glycosyltransferase [Patescibacteria group bacterium]